MDWKIEATDKLKQYEAKRQSLQIIPLEIAQIESTMTGIRSARTDSIAIRNSGGNARENMMLSCIVRKEELQRNFEQAGLWVDAVTAALDVLSDDERKILDRMYIHREKKAADRLAGELFVDIATVYRWKDDALRKFTIALYGCSES